MKKYTIKFSIFNKNLKTTIEAESAIQALQILKSKLRVIDITPEEPPKPKDSDDTLNHLFDIFNIKH